MSNRNLYHYIGEDTWRDSDIPTNVWVLYVCFSLRNPTAELVRRKENFRKRVSFAKMEEIWQPQTKAKEAVIDDKWQRKIITHKMELQVSYRVCAENAAANNIIYGQIKTDIGQILRQLCEAKKVEIIEAEVCKDHTHMLVSIPPHLSVAQFVG